MWELPVLIQADNCIC